MATARPLYPDARKSGMDRTAKPKPFPRFKPPYIREWRQAKGLSLEFVAHNVPMDKGNLSKVERGHLPYSQEMLERLAEILGTEAGNLVSRDPTKEGKVLDLVQRLNERDREKVVAYIEGLQASGGGG